MKKDTSFLLEQVMIPEYQDHDMKLDKRKIGKKEKARMKKYITPGSPSDLSYQESFGKLLHHHNCKSYDTTA